MANGNTNQPQSRVEKLVQCLVQFPSDVNQNTVEYAPALTLVGIAIIYTFLFITAALNCHECYGCNRFITTLFAVIILARVAAKPAILRSLIIVAAANKANKNISAVNSTTEIAEKYAKFWVSLLLYLFTYSLAVSYWHIFHDFWTVFPVTVFAVIIILLASAFGKTNVFKGIAVMVAFMAMLSMFLPTTTTAITPKDGFDKWLSGFFSEKSNRTEQPEKKTSSETLYLSGATRDVIDLQPFEITSVKYHVDKNSRYSIMQAQETNYPFYMIPTTGEPILIPPTGNANSMKDDVTVDAPGEFRLRATDKPIRLIFKTRFINK
jgi:hypothetical protein